jgi:hypothetical protein
MGGRHCEERSDVGYQEATREILKYLGKAGRQIIKPTLFAPGLPRPLRGARNDKLPYFTYSLTINN